MTGPTTRADVSQKVLRFYEELPFNYYGSEEKAVESIRANPIEVYDDLHALLRGDEVNSVLEIGCGAGWFANSLVHHYGKRVVAVDMTAPALERARGVAEAIGTAERVSFVHSDLFDFEAESPADLVASNGVLMCTYDCRAAFLHVARFVAPRKYLFVGLYHLYGRRVFLDMFHEILAREGEEAAFERYRSLAHATDDEVHLRSWFRDQVLHPHETQHSLEEVLEWLDEAGFELLSTSINRFEKLPSRAALIEREKEYEAVSRQRNMVEGRYFPGYFTILARRSE